MQPVLRMCATRCKFYYIGPGRFFKGDFAQNPIAKRRLFRSFSGAVHPFISSRWGFALNLAPCGWGILQDSALCKWGFLQDSVLYERGFMQYSVICERGFLQY